MINFRPVFLRVKVNELLSILFGLCIAIVLLKGRISVSSDLVEGFSYKFWRCLEFRS